MKWADLLPRRQRAAADGSMSLRSARDVPEPALRAAPVLLGRLKLLFGLDWMPLAEDEPLAKLLAKEQKAGRKSYVNVPGAELLGLSNLPVGSGVYSAALYLAETVSQGGREVFVFDASVALGRPVVGMVALFDGSPVPGFDCLVPASEVHALVEDFQALQGGAPVRLAGNFAKLAGMELLQPARVFVDAEPAARIRSLRHPLRSALLAAGIVLLVTAAAAVWWWTDRTRQEQERSQQLAQTRSADEIYESSIGQALHNEGWAGNHIFQRWWRAITVLPLHHHGWRLAAVECSVSQCKHTWKRTHGSFQDFYSRPPAGVDAESLNFFSEPSLVAATISTTQAIEPPQEPMRLQRERLQSQEDTARALASWLQDVSVMGGEGAEVSRPTLFAGAGVVMSAVNKPVVKGSFKLESRAWLLPELDFPGYVVLRRLTLEIPGGLDSLAKLKFHVAGDYYAKGKVY